MLNDYVKCEFDSIEIQDRILIFGLSLNSHFSLLVSYHIKVQGGSAILSFRFLEYRLSTLCYLSLHGKWQWFDKEIYKMREELERKIVK